MGDQKHKLFPDFIIGGAPRAGTTFLVHALDRHPDIYMAKPYRPEAKVFVGPERDPASVYASYFEGARPGQKLGEKTTNYFESADACRRIHATLLDVKLIFLLREPVARAYSNYLWSKKNGLESLPFEQVVDLDEDSRPIPLPPEKAHTRPYHYFQRSHYDIHARNYMEAFGRSRVLFLLYEDIQHRLDPFMQDVQKFVGVSPKSTSSLTSGDVINSAKEMDGPIDPEIEARLRERFAPSVRRLGTLTGLDLRLWGY